MNRSHILASFHAAALDMLIAHARLVDEALAPLRVKYSANQPRVPAGSPDGGQWTDGGGGGVGDRGYYPKPDPIEPAYLVEGLLGGFFAGEVLLAVRVWLGIGEVITGSLDVATARKITKAIEKFLGGKPQRVFRNKHDDLVIMRGGKKIRFDINKPYPHKEPHFHIERQTRHGDWEKVGKTYYPFKGK